MFTSALIAVCGGIGAIVGAAVSTTEKGKEMEENLRDALDIFDDRFADLLPDLTEKVKDLIEGGN